MIFVMMMLFGDYNERWNAAPFVRKYTQDPLSWQQFIANQRKNNPSVDTMDFAVSTEYESAFRKGARWAGFGTSVLQRKRIDFETGRYGGTTDASLIEVRFNAWSTTTWCLIGAVAELAVLVVYREQVREIALDYLKRE